jgi:hypothetical protein
LARGNSSLQERANVETVRRSDHGPSASSSRARYTACAAATDGKNPATTAPRRVKTSIAAETTRTSSTIRQAAS